MDQQGKVKLFRVLKVFFYCLGLPLMFMSVLAISTQFFGHAGFAGSSWLPNNILGKVTIPLSGSAFYGVWIALGVWAFIGAMQILFHYIIKNRRARLVAVCVVTLICMLVPVFVIDASLSAQIDDLAAMAAEDGNGVTVDDYMTQLSYYRTVSSGGGANGRMGNRTEAFQNRIDQLCRDFNIGYGGYSSNGTAGSYNSMPITYAYLGIDINKDGKLDHKDDIVIKVAPTGATKKDPGKLVLKNFSRLKQDAEHMEKYQQAFRRMQDPSAPAPTFTASDFETVSSEEFKEYMPVGRGKNDGYQDVKATLWYDAGKMPMPNKNGMFGSADYSRNGLLGDGYIFGLDTALNVLEMYYGSKQNIDKALAQYNEKNGTNLDFDSYRKELQTKGKEKQQEYYLNGSVEQQLLYLREMEYFKGDFELSPAKLTELLSELGGVIGTNFLFDKLASLFEPTIANALNKGGTIAQILTNLVEGLKGISGGIVGGLLQAVLPLLTGEEWLDTAEWYGLTDKNVGVLDPNIKAAREGLGWAGNGKFDFEPFIDKNANGWCDDGEPFTDLDGDKSWTHEPLNVVRDESGNIKTLRISRNKLVKNDKGDWVYESPRDCGLLAKILGDGTLAHPSALAGIGLDDAIISLVYNKDFNGNGQWDPAEPFDDLNNNGKWDPGEPFDDIDENGVWSPGEFYNEDDGYVTDENGDFVLDKYGHKIPEANGYSPADKYIDANGNGQWDEGEEFVIDFKDNNDNGEYDEGVDEIIKSYDHNGNGKYDPEYLNEKFWGLRIIFKVNTAKKAEYYLDLNNNGKYDKEENEPFTDSRGNGKWDEGEPFTDTNGNGKWDPADEYIDANGNGMWDPAEPFENSDGIGDTWEPGDPFTDLNGNGKWDDAEEITHSYNKNESYKWHPAEPFTDYIDGEWNDGDKYPIYKGVVINLSSDLSAAHLTPLINGVLDVVCSLTGMPRATIDSLLGLVGGLLPVDLMDLETSIMGILQGLYWYQSPDILPFFSEQFYVDKTADPTLQFIQAEMAKYDAAEYAGAKHGTAISSELIAKSGEIGLNSLGAVQQVKMDMSYIPRLYPIMSARDMLLVFSGLSVFWIIISFVCAEKEHEYETGTAPMKVKKDKKNKKGPKKVNSKTKGKVVSQKEETKIPVQENTDKEVK